MEYCIEIQSADGTSYIQQFNGNQLKIGRNTDNDIVLPDAEQSISRYHCQLEYRENSWWIVDETPSANGTFVKRGKSPKIDVRRYGRFRLEDEDEILIVSKLLEANQEIVYWRLRYLDPNKTKPIPELQLPYLEYSLSQKQLWRVNGTRELVKLRQQALHLVDYMANKNQASSECIVICSADELTKEVFSDDYERSNHLTHLVHEIRKKIEIDSGEPEFLKTEGRKGYSLKVRLQS
jgi:pSer/pThr/pTyr-binding forkhead associated (FHA) protein